MQTVDVLAECHIANSFLVQQVAGMFDMDVAAKSSIELHVELPSESDDWTIGAIVGPSGSGKSLTAKQAYGNRLHQSADWDNSRAVIDCFGDHETKKIVNLLTLVGFSSPPAWVKPYAVLSNGERFRCELVRALLGDHSVVAFDEYSSVVDRNVAQICSAALAKAIRREIVNKKFVAVTCHYDILEWLQVDWWVDMANGELARRRLRRPGIQLQIHDATRRHWRMFSRHHYLSSQIGPTKHCFVGTIEGVPVCFASASRFWGKTKRNLYRITRMVVLPDYQGVGIGSTFLDTVAEIVSRREQAGVRITTSHPGFRHHLDRSPKWRIDTVLKHGASPSSRDKSGSYRVARSRGRSVISAEFRLHSQGSHDESVECQTTMGVTNRQGGENH